MRLSVLLSRKYWVMALKASLLKLCQTGTAHCRFQRGALRRPRHRDIALQALHKQLRTRRRHYANAHDPHCRGTARGCSAVRRAGASGPRPGETQGRDATALRNPERAAAARLPLPRERGADVPRLRPAAVPAAGAGAEGRAERRADPARRRRVRPVQHVRRRRALAHDGQAGGRGAALQHLPHDRPVQPDAGRPHHRPQPPLGRVRRHRRSGHGVRRLHRACCRAVPAPSARCCGRTGT